MSAFLLARSFKDTEFTCKCGCGLCIPQAHLVAMLQIIRDEAGVALSIVSGTRCTLHNKNSGSSLWGKYPVAKGMPGDTTASAHTRGQAADIRITGYSRGRIYEFIQELYEKGKIPMLKYVYQIKISTNNVHVGVDDYKKRSTPFGGIA